MFDAIRRFFAPKPLRLMPCAQRIAEGADPRYVIHPGGYTMTQWLEMGYDPNCGCAERMQKLRDDRAAWLGFLV